MVANGVPILVGESRFAIALRGKRLSLALRAGIAASTNIKPGSRHTLTWTDAANNPRKMCIGFVRERDGTWCWFCADARRLELGGEVVRLVDVNADGCFRLHEDGYLLAATRTIVPLAANLVVGSTRVEILELALDGSKVRVLEQPLRGSDQQRQTIAVINKLRATNGLPGVVLDAEISLGCTAHANYLAANDWTGYTNPHTEQANAAAYTRAGARAAPRSVIMKGENLLCVPTYWRTWYHRRHLMSPALSRVGINAEQEHLSVIDVATMDASIPFDWAWPVCVPSDGAVDVPVQASTEKPHEPVKDLGSRGFPIMAVFRYPPDAKVTFRGSLVSVGKRRITKVPTILGKRGFFPCLFGVVPKRPLQHATNYEATLEWHVDGEITRRVLRFRTR